MRKGKLRVAFLQLLGTEMLGSAMVSAVLKQHGHETRMFLEGEEPHFMRTVLAWEPDLVAIQALTGPHNWALATARKLKEAAPEVLVVMGGPHPTYVPEVIEREGIDIIVRGEGELVMAQLADALGARDDYKAIPGTWVKDENGEIHQNEMGELIQDLDSFPFPDRSLAHRYPLIAKRGHKSFIPGRGCPFPCTFCFHHLAMRLYKGQGKWARKHSPEYFIEQILHVRDNFQPMRLVSLDSDDEILHQEDWAKEFLGLYGKRVGLPYYIATRPDSVTEDLARLLKETGCAGVAVSLEIADDGLREEVLKKRYRAEDVRNAMGLFNKYGLRTKLLNMTGIPGETVEDAIETLKMNIELKPTWARCSIVTPYPPMDLYTMAIEKGWFKEGIGVDDFDYFYLRTSQLDLPQIDERINLQKFFSLTVKFPFLLPLVRQLIKVKPNKLYEALGMGFFGLFAAHYDGLNSQEIRELAGATKQFLTRKGRMAGMPKAY